MLICLHLRCDWCQSVAQYLPFPFSPTWDITCHFIHKQVQQTQYYAYWVISATALVMRYLATSHAVFTSCNKQSYTIRTTRGWMQSCTGQHVHISDSDGGNEASGGSDQRTPQVARRLCHRLMTMPSFPCHYRTPLQTLTKQKTWV